MEQVLLRNIEVEDSHKLAVYQSRRGYAAVERALKEMTPEQVIEEVSASGLRGRGGAGFPTGRKWSFVPKGSPKPKYLIVNADESEPGTFKDRVLLERDPHAVIEGAILAAYAIRSHHAFVYVRGELMSGYKILEKASEEARRAGYLGKNIFGSGYDLELTLHRGAGAYICGEETALISSLEGGKGWPRIRPPFPAVSGLYGCPTVVNNVETLAALPWIIDQGAAKYSAMGTEKSKGTKLFSVCGHVQRPGVYEMEMGYPLKKLLEEDCGGVPDGRKLKGVIPGGSSVPVMLPHEIEDLRLDYESMAQAGTLLGSGGVIVMDDTTCMVRAAWNIARFYAHESCGQCTPCREGCHWMQKLFERIERGTATDGDLDLILSISDRIMGKTICPFGDAAAMPAEAFIKKFRDEFEQHIKEKTCTVANGSA